MRIIYVTTQYTWQKKYIDSFSQETIWTFSSPKRLGKFLRWDHFRWPFSIDAFFQRKVLNVFDIGGRTMVTGLGIDAYSEKWKEVVVNMLSISLMVYEEWRSTTACLFPRWSDWQSLLIFRICSSSGYTQIILWWIIWLKSHGNISRLKEVVVRFL